MGGVSLCQVYLSVNYQPSWHNTPNLKLRETEKLGKHLARLGMTQKKKKKKGQFYSFASGSYISTNVGRVEVSSPLHACCSVSTSQKAEDVCGALVLSWTGISGCVPLNTEDASGRKYLGINKHLWQQ